MLYRKFCLLLLAVSILTPLFILGITTLPVNAENVTSNTTLISPDLANLAQTVQDLEQDINNVAATVQDARDLAVNFFEAVVMFTIIIIAFWQRNSFINIVAFLVTFLLALQWFDDYPGVSLGLIALALYFLWITILRQFLKMKREGE